MSHKGSINYELDVDRTAGKKQWSHL